MKTLSGNRRSLLYSLWYKKKKFQENHQLSSDGSFYYDDERLSDELGCCVKTIMRCKRFLRDNGYIQYCSGSFRSKATIYKILKKPDPKSPFKNIIQPDNISPKPDILFLEDPQNVIPNKIITNEINKHSEVLSFKDLKEGYLGLVKSNGAEFAFNFYLRLGCDKETLDKIRDEVVGL